MALAETTNPIWKGLYAGESKKGSNLKQHTRQRQTPS